jgi:drug/metabolite transporter (DMT)-like permease
MDMRWLGIAAALGSSVSWAAGSLLFQQIGKQLPAPAITLAKGVVSLVLLGLATSLVGWQSLDQGTWFVLFLSGVLGITLGDTFFFRALQSLGAHAVVLLMMLGQVFTVLLAVLWLKESPTASVWVGIFCIVLGIAIVLSAPLSGSRQRLTWWGIGYGVLAVVCMSTSLVIAKPVLAEVATLQATWIRMFSGTIGTLCFGLTGQRLSMWFKPFKDIRLLLFFLFSVCVVTFGGFWLSLVAIKFVDVSIATPLNSIEPIFVLPLAAVFLKEKITARAVIGTLFAIAGIVAMCIN